jgi:hypothetical protein
MRHFANPSFWECYRELPASIQELADRNFELLKSNPRHPSLYLKKVGRKYRALAVKTEEGLIWFWIGTHAEYNGLVR